MCIRDRPKLSLPRVVPSGQQIGEISPHHCRRWGLKVGVKLVSGATDSNAAFYASGAGQPGEWSTTIGTTLAIKGISHNRINDPTGCIYCHRHPDGYWLPGGASNAGGEILRDHRNELSSLEETTNPDIIPNCLVYPSVRKGERLPFFDVNFVPFFEGDKRSGNDYLLACMEGIAFVESLSYSLLEKYGALVGNNIFATGGAVSSVLVYKSVQRFYKSLCMYLLIPIRQWELRYWLRRDITIGQLGKFPRIWFR